MTTATGQVAVNFAVLSDQNPWSNGAFTVVNGGTTRIASGVLRPNTTGIFAYTGGTYDAGPVAVSAEINATADDDEVLLGALDQNGDGFMLRVRTAAVVVLVYDNYVVVDSFGSGTTSITADDLYQFTVTKGSPNTVAATKNGSPITLSGSTYSLTLGNLRACWSAKAENVGLSAIKSLAVVDGLVATSGYTMTADAGSYTLTGQAAGLLTGGFITADPGSYTLIGSDALRDIEMDADVASYALNGQAASLINPKTVTADTGFYSLIGQAVALLTSVAASIRKSRKRRRFFGSRLSR